MNKSAAIFSCIPFLITACATTEQPPSSTAPIKKPSLTIDMGWTSDSQTLKKIADAFENDTGVQVKIYGADYRRSRNIYGPLNTDIVCTTHDQFAYAVAKNVLQPLSPSSEIKEANVGIAWDGMTQGGTIWAYPLVVEVIAMYYNKKLIENPPQSFEELDDLDKRLMAEKQVHAISWDYANSYYSWPIFASGGAYPFPRNAIGGFDTSTTGITSSTAGTVAALSLLNTFVKNGILPPKSSYEDSLNAMLDGKVAMTLDGPWIIPRLKNAGIDFGVKPTPTLNGKPGKAFVAFWGCGISKKADKALATKFLENYVLNNNKPTQLFDEGTLVGLPANKNAFKHLYQYSYIRELMLAVNNGKPTPPLTEMGVFYKELSKAIEASTSGKSSPEDALNNAAKKVTAQ